MSIDIEMRSEVCGELRGESPRRDFAKTQASPLERPQPEETWNTITHGLGAVASVAATGCYLRTVWTSGTSLEVAAAGLVFCLSMTAVYVASTLSHCLQDVAAKVRMRQWDQGLIYLMIAGTYTPYSVAYLQSQWVLGVMWLLALVGFFSKVAWSHRLDRVSTANYLLIGWLPCLTLPWFVASAPAGATFIVLLGGVFYTLGVPFLLFDRKASYMHAIWHLMVLAGSATHFLGVLWYRG